MKFIIGIFGMMLLIVGLMLEGKILHPLLSVLGCFIVLNCLDNTQVKGGII